MKRIKRDREEMEEIMFKLSEKQPNLTLKQLIQETDQPEVSHRQALLHFPYISWSYFLKSYFYFVFNYYFWSRLGLLFLSILVLGYFQSILDYFGVYLFVFAWVGEMYIMSCS